MSAIRVLGLVSESHIVEDIGVSVPYGQTVEIPGETAHRSRDLWRAIGQKSLLQVTMVPTQPTPYVDLERVKRLESYVTELETKLGSALSKITALESENKSLQESVKVPTPSSETDSKLDQILSALQNGRVSTGLSEQASIAVSHAFEKFGSKPFVDSSIPSFLPSEIVPKNLDAQISAREEASSSTGVSGAAGKLRQIRKAKENS